jgi:predicted homoserine dehydrogenase-like protein
MGRGIALQILQSVPGMRLCAIANRKLEGADRAYREAGVEGVDVVRTAGELDDAIGGGRYAITEDASLFAQSDLIEAVIEVTGAVEYGAHVATQCIAGGKHVILMNAELDGTVGAILKVRADAAGVVVTNVDGDQPGVTMNLYRFVKGLGVTPVLCGNIKGLHDPYRNPTTQEGFARKWKQKPHMVTSFADGSKISFEQALVANATGMRVARRGMYGHTVEPGTPIEQAARLFDPDEVCDGPGIVDYVVGAVPGPGVFVLGKHDHPMQQHYLNLYKLGEGPLYCFYAPYHLCHFEVPNTVARAVLFDDATITPAGAPTVDVVATAKIALDAGQTIDGIGGYMT